MKINIFKSEANKDHLLLVVEWPADITKEIANFLKQVPSVESESVIPEKTNAVAFKLATTDEEEEKEMKMAIISTIRKLLNDGKPQVDEKTTFLLTREQMQGLMAEIEKLNQDNILLKGELILRKVSERYLLIAASALFLTSILALILTGLAIVSK